MSKILEGITIETFPEAVRKGLIKPGQRFAIVLEDDAALRPASFTDIARTMRATAAARGMTTEIFDNILDQA